MGAGVSSDYYGEDPGKELQISTSVWEGLKTTQHTLLKSDIIGRFSDLWLNFENSFTEFNFNSIQRQTMQQINSPLSKKEVADLLLNVYEQIENKDDAIEYLIQDDSPNFLKFILPIENLFNNCSYYANIYSNITEQHEKLSGRT